MTRSERLHSIIRSIEGRIPDHDRQALIHLAEELAAPPIKPGEIMIWSGEHKAWWRPGGVGYTDNPIHAGRWPLAEALRITAHCGPSKQIEIREAARWLIQ